MKSSCKVLFSFLAFLLLSIEGAFAAAPEITADAAVIYDPAAKVPVRKERDEEGISGQHDKDHDGDSFF